MNFGMDYFSLLTGRINNTNYLLNQYANQRTGKTSKGNGIQKSYGAFNTVNNSGVYGSLYKLANQSNEKLLSGASKADNAGKQLASRTTYSDDNRDLLYSNVKNLVSGYNEIVDSASSNKSATISNRANVMKRIAIDHKSELENIGITYNYRTGNLTVDDDKLKSADSDTLQKVFGANGSFGQNVRASAIVTENTASAQLMNQSKLAALSSSYGMNGSYNGLGGFGLSSFFGNWFI